MKISDIRSAVEAFRHFFEDKTGRPSSSVIYPAKLIYYFLKMYRNRALFEIEQSQGRGAYDLSTEMTIPCIELIKVDQVECPCAPASGCLFMKSKHPLPRMQNGVPHSVSLLKQHGSQKNYGSFTFVDWYKFEDKINGRIASQAFQPYFTMKNISSNRHLYVYGNSEEFEDLKAVSAVITPNDPLEFLSFPICGDDPILCNPLDVEFIIEDNIQSRVFELTFNALGGFRSMAPGADLLNNDSNDVVSSIL